MPTGSFMIYGKKNFINPLKLEMGFGILFRVDDESAQRHKGERRIKTDLVHQSSLNEKESEQAEEQDEEEETQKNTID